MNERGSRGFGASRLLRYRPSPRPALAAPLCVRSVGLYETPPGWEERRPARGFVQLWWMTRGECRFEIDGRPVQVGVEEAFVYGAEDGHALAAGPAGAAFCFATFDGPEPLGALALAGWRRGARWAGPCPEGLFRALLDGIEGPGTESERRCSVTAYDLVLEASAQGSAEGGVGEGAAERAYRLLQRRFGDPRFGVAELESSLGIHRATLFRQCRKRFGKSPSELLIRLRLERGAALLRDTSLPVGEVALLSGFADANYFAKAIRRWRGRSPSELRAGTGRRKGEG